MKKTHSKHVSWRGWELRTGAQADPNAIKEFENATPPIADVESRYELLAVAARGFHPPQALSATVVTESEQLDPNAEECPGLRLAWSLLYREIAETAPPAQRPYAIYLLGVNPPDGASDTDLAAFNDFYTNVHLVEVAERRGALRAMRYELIEEVKAPYLGAPQFLAVYEVDEASASHRRHVGPPYTAGPEVWRRHTTPWRLWYRRLGS